MAMYVLRNIATLNHEMAEMRRAAREHDTVAKDEFRSKGLLTHLMILLL